MKLILLLALLATLSDSDVDRLAKYGDFWGISSEPEWARPNPEQQRRLEQALEQARAEFGGRGVEIADYFLKHTDYRIRNEAYWFVLRAVADRDTALLLVRSLLHPPAVTAGIMPRDGGEVGIAIESVLADETVGRDAVVVSALVDVVRAGLPQDQIGAGSGGAAVLLLGKARSPAAVEALESFTREPNRFIRALAVQALGDLATSKGGRELAEASAGPITGVLRSDQDPQARVEAAGALGKLANAEATTALRQSLQTERSSQVVDAIVTALERLDAPVTDPETCRRVVERASEPAAVMPCFQRWRAVATDDQLVEAATTAPATLRVLALQALAGPPARLDPRLLVYQRPPPPPRQFEPATRDRLLNSCVELLSRGRQLSYSAMAIVQEALWEIAGRQMPTALRYADRVTPIKSRYETSVALSRKDLDAYVSYRRTRQLFLALWLALPIAVATGIARVRRPAVLILASAAAWMLWTTMVRLVRELPPPPLQLLTVSCIAALTVGLVAIGLVWLCRTSVGRLFRRRGAVAVAGLAAPPLALVFCAWTRATGRFPVGGDGWELFWDPIFTAILAFGWGLVLGLLDAFIFKPPPAGQGVRPEAASSV